MSDPSRALEAWYKVLDVDPYNQKAAEYVDFVRKTERMRSKVTSALIYPALLTFMSVGLICLLLFYILPKFSTFFVEFDKDLPLLTELVMAFSVWLQGHGILMLAVIIIGGVAARAWYGTPAGRLFFHGLALRIPLAGKVLRVSPPLTITPEELDEALALLDTAWARI